MHLKLGNPSRKDTIKQFFFVATKKVVAFTEEKQNKSISKGLKRAANL